MLSIITINYNNKEGLESTIKSVQNQDALNFEHIIIDGNSDDGSKTTIENNNNTFAYAISEPDTGIYNAMNKGIKASKGDYVLFINSGDTLYSNTTISEVSKFTKSGLDIYYGDLNNVGDTINKRVTFVDELSFGYFYNGGYLPHPASLIKRSLFDSIHFYKEIYKIAADWDFFVNAICKYNVSYKHVNLIISNFDINGVSNQEDFVKSKLEEKQKSLQSNFPLFLKEAKRLREYSNLFGLNRFKDLRSLESNPIANKLNSIWFKIMTFFFTKK